jgi:hypothetical protein
MPHQPSLFPGTALAPNWPFGDLRPLGYSLLVVDPPWNFQLWSEKGHEKAPQSHYDCMSTADIEKLPVGSLAAPDCVLLMCGRRGRCCPRRWAS